MRKYDSLLGRLWQVSSSSGTTQFLYDGDELALEYDGSGNIAHRYFFGPGTDEPILDDTGGALNCSGTKFLHTDHQGSVIALADCWGNRTNVNSYDEYGIPGAGNAGRFQYTGQAYIPEIGMYYYKARIYSPTLGRFLQTDPVGYEDQVNLYAYVKDDPVNGTDPTGQSCLDADAAPCNSPPQTVKPTGDPAVGHTTESALSKVLTNEIGSLSTPKGGDPKQLQNGAGALANALINNANKNAPNKVAPDTGTASSALAKSMHDAVENRANGGADPVHGRTFYGTSHTPPDGLHSRPIGTGRQSVYEHFGPFKDGISRLPTYIYIYNDPGQ